VEQYAGILVLDAHVGQVELLESLEDVQCSIGVVYLLELVVNECEERVLEREDNKNKVFFCIKLVY
jgi:hypothetical protein